MTEIEIFVFISLVCYPCDGLGGVDEFQHVGGGGGGVFPTWLSIQLMVVFHVTIRLI